MPPVPIPVYVLNLDRSTDRLAHITGQLSAMSMPFVRIAAVDGRAYPTTDDPEYSAARTRRFMGRELNAGELGCHQSHRAAARLFLASTALARDDSRSWAAAIRAPCSSTSERTDAG